MSNIRAFNNMHMKGFDSPKQESYVWQQWTAGNPQFWWVLEVFNLHGHAPGWENLVRNPDGTYNRFPKSPGSKSEKTDKTDEKPTKKSSLQERLLVLATLFPVPMAEQAIEIIEVANDLNEQE